MAATAIALDRAPDQLWSWMIAELCRVLGHKRVAVNLGVDGPTVRRLERGELPSSRVRDAATMLFARQLAYELDEDA